MAMEMLLKMGMKMKMGNGHGHVRVSGCHSVLVLVFSLFIEMGLSQRHSRTQSAWQMPHKRAD